MESRKRDDQTAEWASLWFQLSKEDRAVLRGLLLVKLYRHRTWEIKDLEGLIDLRGLHILG
jgi:hypothetical protein